MKKILFLLLIFCIGFITSQGLIPPVGYTSPTNFTNATVNDSLYWMGMGAINTTQMEDNGGTLNLLEGWFDSLWCRLTGCTMQGNLNVSGKVVVGTGANYLKLDNNELFSAGDKLYLKGENNINFETPVGTTRLSVDWYTGIFDFYDNPFSRVESIGGKDGLWNITENGNGKFTGNVTANWFKGKFNWTSGDDWNLFDGSELLFNETKLNETIDDRNTNVSVEYGQNSTGGININRISDQDILQIEVTSLESGLWYLAGLVVKLVTPGDVWIDGNLNSTQNITSGDRYITPYGSRGGNATCPVIEYNSTGSIIHTICN